MSTTLIADASNVFAPSIAPSWRYLKKSDTSQHAVAVAAAAAAAAAAVVVVVVVVVVVILVVIVVVRRALGTQFGAIDNIDNIASIDRRQGCRLLYRVL